MKWLTTVAVVLFGLLQPMAIGWAQDPEAALPSLEQLDGVWRVAYVDEELGNVSGEAHIDAAAGSAVVRYEHPTSGTTVTLTSTALRFEDGQLVIDLEGRSLQSNPEDGLRAPEVAVAVDPTDDRITLHWGESSAEMGLTPLPETDLARVQLVFDVQDDLLSGHWRYRSHQFIGRAGDGTGRTGDTAPDANGVTWTSGLESWRRPKAIVHGIIPLEDQLALEVFSDGTTAPHYPYPFARQGAVTGRTRTLFVFGTDLPSDYSRRLTIEGVDPGVTYEVLARRSDAERSPHYAELFAKGWEMLRQRLPDGVDRDKVIADLEGVLVRVRLQPEVVPGLLTIKLDEQEAAWLLQFGDNLAQLRVVRPVGRGRAEFEATGFAFPGEFVRIEVETAQPLPVEGLDVIVGVDGGPLLLGDGTGIPAGRDARNPRIYRTDYIYLDPELPAGHALDYRASAGFYAVPVRQGSAITATLGNIGLISLPPAMAQTTVFQTVGDSAVGGDWGRWLDMSIACTGDAASIDRTNADTITEYLISEFLTNTFGLRFEVPIWLEAKVSVGQHAAMLLMRDTFVRLLERNRAQFARLSTDEEMLAFRRQMEPVVRQGRSPLAKMPVTGIDGTSKTDFIWTFEKSILARLHDRQIDEVESWAIAATREALASYLDAMAEAVARAQEIDACDIESLLKLTGKGFDPVARIAKSKLMLDASGTWFPHHRARAYVDTVALLGDQLEIQEKVGDEDTEMVVMSVGLASIPVAIVGGAYGYVGGAIATFVIDLFDVAYGTYAELDQKWQQDSEVRFATGAADVLGMSRLYKAKEAQRSWSQVFVKLGFIVGPAAVGGVFDAPEVFKAFDAVLSLKQGLRGRAALMAMNDIPAAVAGGGRAPEVAALIEAAISEAADATVGIPGPARRQLAEIVEDVPAVSRTVDGPAGPTALAVEARPLGVNFDDLPDLPRGALKDVAAHLDGIDVSARLSQFDAGALDNALDDLAGLGEGARWAESFNAENVADLVRHYEVRADVRRFLDAEPERLAAQLQHADARRARIARQVLNSDPGLSSMEAFERRVDELMGRRDEPISQRFYEQAGDAAIESRLREEGWHDNYVIAPRADSLLRQAWVRIVDPDNNIGAVTRGFEPETGTFHFQRAVRQEAGPSATGQSNRPIRGMIQGLDVPLDAARGTPTLQYYTMKIMYALGIPYGATNGIKKAEMHAITNTRTIAQVNWFKETYYPGVPWEKVPKDELSEFLLGTHSARYGAEVLAFSGYKVTGARLELSGGKSTIEKLRGNYELDRGAETFEQFIERYGLFPRSEVEHAFSLVLNVEPW